MSIESFIATVDLVGGELGIGLRQTAPGVPQFDVDAGPFPARFRLGFDLDPEAGLVPGAVVELIVGEVADRWAVMAAWSTAPSAAMAEHNLPVPLPVPDLTFEAGLRRTAEIAYRVPLDGFDTAWAVNTLHAAMAFASFMARELLPATAPARIAELARYGIAAGAPVPFPGDLLVGGGPRIDAPWAAV